MVLLNGSNCHVDGGVFISLSLHHLSFPLIILNVARLHDFSLLSLNESSPMENAFRPSSEMALSIRTTRDYSSHLAM